jgi:hypothetical protein
MQIYFKFMMTFVFFICAILLFSYCGMAEATSEVRTLEVSEPEEMIGIELRKTGMRAPSLFFSLREENGETLFSSSEFELEDVVVQPEYMQELREIAKKHGFVHMKEKDMSKGPFVVDAPMYHMTMYWPEKKSLRLNYWPAHDELEKFFQGIVEACVNKPGEPDDISSLTFANIDASEDESFRFELSRKDGKFLLNAYCYMSDIEKVTLRRAPMDAADVQNLREIVKEHGIVNMKGNHVYQGRSAPPPPYILLDIYWPDKRILRLNRPESGTEELEKFFRELALANSELWEPTHVPELLSWLTFTRTRENESDSFMFHLREVSASTELMARCVAKNGEKLEFYVTVDPKYMDQLREIVKRHGIVDSLKKMPYSERERSVNYDDKPYGVLTIDWWHDPRLRTTEWPACGEELEKFFRDLAEEYK